MRSCLPAAAAWPDGQPDVCPEDHARALRGRGLRLRMTGAFASAVLWPPQKGRLARERGSRAGVRLRRAVGAVEPQGVGILRSGK